MFKLKNVHIRKLLKFKKYSPSKKSDFKMSTSENSNSKIFKLENVQFKFLEKMINLKKD
jgi:hypothetical protein